jgi:hypothetical protein
MVPGRGGERDLLPVKPGGSTDGRSRDHQGEQSGLTKSITISQSRLEEEHLPAQRGKRKPEPTDHPENLVSLGIQRLT